MFLILLQKYCIWLYCDSFDIVYNENKNSNKRKTRINGLNNGRGKIFPKKMNEDLRLVET